MYGPVFNYTPGSTYGTGQPTEGSSSPFSKPFATGGSHDSLSLSGQPGEHKKSQGFIGAAKDFGKGIIKGGLNAVTSLFTLQGMALALGTAALVAVAPAIAIPLLVAGGVTMGGMQVAKGASTGNWEQAGEGTFTLAATMLGAKVGPKSFKGANGEQYAFVKTATKEGVTTISKPTGFWGTTWANLKASFGGKLAKLDKDGNALITPDGKLAEGKNIYQLGKDSVTARFNSIKAKSSGSAANSAEAAVDSAVKTESTTTTAVDGATDAVKTDSLKPQTARERLLARKQQEELKNGTGKIWRIDEQGNLVSSEGPTGKVQHMDEKGVGFTTTEMEESHINKAVSKIKVDMAKAKKAAVDYEESGYLGSFGTTPEKIAKAKAGAKAEVLSRYQGELDTLLANLEPSEKARFIKLMDSSKPEHRAEFSALKKTVQDRAIEQQKLYQAASGGKSLNQEIAQLKLLQKAGDLNEADAALLKTLEEKYPHRSSASVLNRKELAELKSLHTAQTNGTITEVESARLKALRQQFPDDSSQLVNTRYIDMIQQMRQDADLSKLPKPIQERWAPELEIGKEHFQRQLDFEEFASLKALRGNKAFEFQDTHLNRYNELESTLKSRLQTVEGQTSPELFVDDTLRNIRNDEMTRLKAVLTPQETVNPSPQALKSLEALDQEIYQSSLKDAPAVTDKPIVTAEADAANTPEKSKKWFSMLNGPQGTGQILATTIAGSTMDEQSAMPGGGGHH